jgi:hypothetical protein
MLMSTSTSIVQIEANRRNAEKSTGPKTPEGKQAVASNAVKHGLFARQLILNDEDPEEYQALVDGLQDALSLSAHWNMLWSNGSPLPSGGNGGWSEPRLPP